MKELQRGAEAIVCPVCRERAKRVGAQNMCDVYVCEASHLTRIWVGDPREVWRKAGEKEV